MKELFYKPLKFKNQKVFFWSDLHLNHESLTLPTPLWRERGFDSLESHDRTLIHHWNEKVGAGDVVFLLGDTMFGFHAEEKLRAFFQEVCFRTCYVLPGNHQAGFKQLLNACEGNRLNLAGKEVVFCPNYLEIVVDGQGRVLSHYAMPSWNDQGASNWQLHGHSHGNLAACELGRLLYQAKTLDVGVENFSHPVSFEEIRELLEQKEPLTFDHHHAGTRHSL